MGYATLEMDQATGLEFIIDYQTKRRLYKHPNCEICGIATYSFAMIPPPCLHHKTPERNDNDQDALVLL